MSLRDELKVRTSLINQETSPSIIRKIIHLTSNQYSNRRLEFPSPWPTFEPTVVRVTDTIFW